MGLEQISPAKVEYSMKLNFPEHINKDANWRYSSNDESMTISGYINGKEYKKTIQAKVYDNGKLIKINYPNHAVAIATEFFQGIIKTQVPQAVKVEVEDEHEVDEVEDTVQEAVEPEEETKVVKGKPGRPKKG